METLGLALGALGIIRRPAFPIRPASSDAVRICRLVVGTSAFGRPLGEGLVTALCLLCLTSAEMLRDRSPSCTEQDSSLSGFVPNRAAEEGE